MTALRVIYLTISHDTNEQIIVDPHNRFNRPTDNSLVEPVGDQLSMIRLICGDTRRSSSGLLMLPYKMIHLRTQMDVNHHTSIRPCAPAGGHLDSAQFGRIAQITCLAVGTDLSHIIPLDLTESEAWSKDVDHRILTRLY